MFRKRYTVVVVGLRGSSAAQRSEISRHRREREALVAAEDERDRLMISQGAHAANYEVVVERDGAVVETLRAVPQDPEPQIVRDAAPPAGGMGLFGDDVGDLEDILDPGPAAARAAAPPPDGDTAAHPADAGPAPEARPAPEDDTRPPRLPSWDEIPVGPVPEDVLEYFESAVAREERRRAERRPDDPEDAR